MNKPELIDKIAEAAGLSKKEAGKALEGFCQAVKEAVKSDDSVRLIGFGTFSRVKKQARAGRNPHTKEVIQIPACLYPKFKPGKEFKDYIN